jgi:dipeptidyl aminopeptidase/acylaminoacyl peptidase
MRWILAFALIAAPVFAKRPITHEDVWTMKRVGAPAVSPDGKLAVVGITEPAYDNAETSSDLWLVTLDGSAPPRRLTASKAGESGATFSPDGKQLGFLAKRDGDEAPQVYALPLDGGEAQRLTNLSTGVDRFQWRKDGKALLLESRVYPGANDDEANKKAAAERKARKYNARVYDSYPFRYWDRWLDDRRPHVFVQEIGGKPRDLLAGTKLAALPGFDGTRGVGDAGLESAWSPDGEWIVFVALEDRQKSVAAPVFTRLYRVRAAGGEPEALTQGPESYAGPQFSPDGKALFAVRTEGDGKQLYSLGRLMRMEWPAVSTPKVLAANWDRSVSGYEITPDSRTIYIVSEESGHDELFRMSATGGAVQKLTNLKEGIFSGLAIPAQAMKLVALWGSMTHPEDVAVIDPATGTHKLVTDFHRAKIADLDWQPPIHHWTKASNGKRIHSLIVLPPNFDKSRKYPLVVFPHGGPHNMTKDQFFVRWNYHLLTTPGFVLLMPNYTGSTGFGEKFANDIHGDILRGPAKEIEEAADAVIKEFSFIDGTRQAAAGASYGGYLMNWFEGNTTRFQCLVNHAGLTDNWSMWGSTDGAYYWEKRAGGPPWELQGAWRDQSPAAYAANFRTPMLVTHGEQDFRVPISQGFEIYKLLQRKGVPSRFVVFPDANHWVLKGEDARFHMQEVLAWLKKYL